MSGRRLLRFAPGVFTTEPFVHEYWEEVYLIDGDLTVGELVGFNMLAGRVAQPVLRLAQLWQDFHQARLSIARLGDILNTNPEQTYSPSQTALPAIRGDISFEQVTFRYRIDGPAVLQDVSFSVPSGPARARARLPS